MAKLELTRTAEDHRVHVLPGVGELRSGGWMSGKVEATAGGQSYTFSKPGLLGRIAKATDGTGAEAGEIRPRNILRDGGGGTIVWRTTEWDLRPATEAVDGYALARAGQSEELALIEEGTWGGRPLGVSVADGSALDPGLLLFALFATRLVTEDIDKIAAGGGRAAPFG